MPWKGRFSWRERRFSGCGMRCGSSTPPRIRSIWRQKSGILTAATWFQLLRGWERPTGISMPGEQSWGSLAVSTSTSSSGPPWIPLFSAVTPITIYSPAGGSAASPQPLAQPTYFAGERAGRQMRAPGSRGMDALGSRGNALRETRHLFERSELCRGFLALSIPPRAVVHPPRDPISPQLPSRPLATPPS